MKLTRRIVDAADRAVGAVRLARFRPSRPHDFFIVSAAHNAADFVDRHLDSIAAQRFDAARIHHLIIDDASGDATAEIVQRRIDRGAGYDLRLRRNETRRGGCANLTRAFRESARGSIVLQVDADDWLPDPKVLAYLDMLYHDPDLWMTYNSWISADGSVLSNSHPLPARVVRTCSYREHPWVTSHLHSFRSELFTHVLDESLIDPKTGDYWDAAVDMSQYFPMLELAGRHGRHVRRITYAYNVHPGSLISAKREHQLDCERRIRALPRYAPLESLSFPSDTSHRSVANSAHQADDDASGRAPGS